jgi:hypothetical protein
MSTTAEAVFSPRVRGATTAQSPNVRSVMDCLNDATYYVPEYQRDSSQWDIPKKSLFIESLINNLTVPPLIAYPEDDSDTRTERWQIVDGQQRITTIKEFIDNEFALAKEDQVEYAENVAPIIQGKRFADLPGEMQKQIERYTLNFILLPKNLQLQMRLEIFRRINEGGVPLSAHDLRLPPCGNLRSVSRGRSPDDRSREEAIPTRLSMEGLLRVERLVERKGSSGGSGIVSDVPVLRDCTGHS